MTHERRCGGNTITVTALTKDGLLLPHMTLRNCLQIFFKYQPMMQKHISQGNGNPVGFSLSLFVEWEPTE
jgi:hypothetical protein